MERELASYQIARQFELQRDREATVLGRELSVKDDNIKQGPLFPLTAENTRIDGIQ